MRLPKLSIDNYQFTLVIFILLLFAGIRSYVTMPRTENPDIVLPGVSVIVIYPGASPVDLEELIASPIEEAINELDDIKRINTSLIDGVASIAVEFDFSTDADKKYDEVVQKVNGIKSNLPEEILDLKMIQWTSSDVAMLQLALVSDKASYHELESQAAVGVLNPNAFHRGFADHYKVVLHLFSELNVRSQFGEADRKKTVPQSGFKDGFQTHLRARRAVDYYPG